jgi:hypothetical protein
VLKANGTEGQNIKDYVKLSHPLKLPAYRIELPYYPWLPPVKPFDGWRPGDSTTSLPWYSAYNKVKHHRETAFSQATLEHAFQALAGCFVMLCAEYGSDFALKGEAAKRAFFRVVAEPTWDPSELYVPPFKTGEWKQKSYRF